MASVAKQYPDMWLDPQDDPRADAAPLAEPVPERENLLDYLRHYRLTFEKA